MHFTTQQKKNHILLNPFLVLLTTVSSQKKLPQSGPNAASERSSPSVGLFLIRNSTPSLLTVKPKKHLYQHSARSNTGAGQCYFWQPYHGKCTSAHNLKPNQLPDLIHTIFAVQDREEPLEEWRRKHLSLRNKQQEEINTSDWYYSEHTVTWN